MQAHPLTIYYVPSCAFSIATVTFLVLRGVDFRAINIDEHLQERGRLARALDRELETPIIAFNEKYYVAPSLSELKSLLQPTVRSMRSARDREHAHHHPRGHSV